MSPTRSLTDRDDLVDIGLMVARIGLGGMFMWHGWPKVWGGPATWAKIGGAMKHVGVDVWPTPWGFLAAFAEFGGGLALALGIFARPAAAMLVMTMVVAARMHFARGDGIAGASHAIELGIVMAALFISGPGRYALELRWRRD